MQVVHAGALPHTAQMSGPTEKSEGPGPDHDGDGDDSGVFAAAAVKSTPQPGVGTQLDVSA